MSELFITGARLRLERALKLSYKAEESMSTTARLLADELRQMAAIVGAAIDATDNDGSLPSSICNAVVKYGRPKESR